MKILEKKLDGNSVIIAPFGDLQYGNLACSVSYARRYLSFVEEMAHALNVPHYFIGTGDYMDLMSPSNRDRYKASGLYGSTRRTINDRTVVPIVEETRELLSPMYGKTLTLHQGHHWMFMDPPLIDDSGREQYHTDKWLASQLGAVFVEGAAIVKLAFPSGREYRILATHGQGNGSTPTYGLNKLSRDSKSWEAIDCFVMGHTHKVGIAAEIRLYEENGQLRGRQTPLITSGAFMRSYLVGEMNYPEEKQLGSLALGGTMLYLSDRGDGPSGLIQSAIAVL